MEKITKQKRGVALSLMIAALLAVTAFSFISMENGSDDDGSTLGAAGDYNAGDIAAINLIIKNNGLNWTCADPADGSSVPSDWTGVTWSEDDTDRRITKLGLSNTELFGDLDVSGLTALEDLNCSTNVLESLNVSGLAALETLYCNNNLLVSLDVSKNTALRNLNCEYNVIGALDVSGLTALESLKCGANKLIALDVTKNILLERLYCNGNNLVSLDLSKNSALTELECINNALTSLDVTGCPLERLYCNNNFMSDDKKVAGFKGTWNDEDGKFKFDTQYKGTPLKFLSDEDFMVVETDGNIKSIDVSTGVTGGNGPYSYSMYNQNGTPEGISIDSDTGVISGKLEKGEQGVMTIDVSALDDDGLSISKSIRIAYSLPGEPGKKNDDNGDGGDNTLLYVAIAAIAAVAIVAVVYVLLKKRKAKQ